MSESDSEDLPKDVALAKGLPALALLAGLGLAVLVVAVVEVASLGERVRLVVLPAGLLPLSVAMLYQATFVWRNPEKSIEHDVTPPSKYDLSYDSKLGARLTAALTAVAGALGMTMVGVGAWMLL